MQLNLEDKKTETNSRIKLSNDSVIECPISYKLIPITIGETTFPMDPIQFDLSNFDIILGMNWVHTYGAKIDCEDLKVILKDKKGSKVYFYGKKDEVNLVPWFLLRKQVSCYVKGVLDISVMLLTPK